MGFTEFIQIIAATVGSLGFALLFNVRGYKLIGVTLGGLIGWLTYLVSDLLINSEELCYFLAAVSISIYAEVMARVMKTPVTSIITTALIPLVPGASLYYTMASILSDSESFGKSAFRTLGIAAALAAGIIVSAILTKLVTKSIALIKATKTRDQSGKGI